MLRALILALSSTLSPYRLMLTPNQSGLFKVLLAIFSGCLTAQNLSHYDRRHGVHRRLLVACF
jgi:hypothetical protein